MEENYYHHKSPFRLESGAELPEFKVCYVTYGNPNAEKIVWVCHALTANAAVADWWPGLVGTGCYYNPEEYFIICANVLGSCYGSTGPLDVNPDTGRPYFRNFPLVTIRDIVQGFEFLRQHLGIKKIHTCLGGSLGGQQAIEWAILRPDLFENIVLLATNARHSAWGIALNETQRMAILADPTWGNDQPDGGLAGMKAARAIALLSYRNYATFEDKQTDTDFDLLDNFRASSYQRYQAEKFSTRFNAYSYWTLTKALDTHNVGRNRGGTQRALALVKAKALIIGISSDLLFPIKEQKYLATHITGAHYEEIDSLFGHDGFLVEFSKILPLLERFYN